MVATAKTKLVLVQVGQCRILTANRDSGDEDDRELELHVYLKCGVVGRTSEGD
jgi:hypothetical protein